MLAVRPEASDHDQFRGHRVQAAWELRLLREWDHRVVQSAIAEAQWEQRAVQSAARGLT